MTLWLRMNGSRLVVQAAWVAVAAMLGVIVVLLIPANSGRAPLATVGSLHMPVPRVALDRTFTIGPKPGVTQAGGTRLDIESRYGQFRGHWWWNHGWVYVSGSVLPGSRIRVQLDRRSLTVSATPDARANEQIRHFGRHGYGDYIQVDAVRFGIGGTLMSYWTARGPFAGRQMLDQVTGNVWTKRGLTITREYVTSSPRNAINCDRITQQPTGVDLGCPMFGERPLVSDRRGRFGTLPDSVVAATSVSLTATPYVKTQLPTDSMRIEW